MARPGCSICVAAPGATPPQSRRTVGGVQPWDAEVSVARLRFVIAAGVVTVALAVGPAWAQVVRVSPLNPTASDSIRVTAYSGFSSTGCWDVGDVACAMTAPDTLSIVVAIGYCHGLPGCMCAAFPMSYQRSCTFGPLSAGGYVAKFTELHTSSYDRLATFSRTTPFVVSGTTPTFGRTWGALKSIYR